MFLFVLVKTNKIKLIKMDVCEEPTPNKWNIDTPVANAPSPLNIDNILVGKQLGKGKFGNVYLARLKETNKQELQKVLALKVILKKQIKEAKLESQIRNEYSVFNFLGEYLIQSSLDHPNIIKLYGHFCDEERIYFVLEYANKGDLYDEYARQKRLSEKRVAQVMQDVILGLQYLHSENIIHRDVKPENILINNENDIETAKIADFGYAIKLESSKQKVTDFVGTMDYLAPELIDNKPYSFSVDIWAIGVIIYELLVGETPFYSKTISGTYKRIQTVDLKLPEFLSDNAKDLIKKILVLYPEYRLSLQDMLTHPFFSILY